MNDDEKGNTGIDLGVVWCGVVGWGGGGAEGFLWLGYIQFATYE